MGGRFGTLRQLLEFMLRQKVPLRRGLQIGVLNSRGVASRGPLGGGQQERDVTGKYEGWADQLAAPGPEQGSSLTPSLPLR